MSRMEVRTGCSQGSLGPLEVSSEIQRVSPPVGTPDAQLAPDGVWVHGLRTGPRWRGEALQAGAGGEEVVSVLGR